MSEQGSQEGGAGRLAALTDVSRVGVASEHTRLMALGVVMGLLGGLAAWGFDAVAVAVGQLLLGTGEPSVEGSAWWRRLLAPGVGGLASGAVIAMVSARGRPQSIPDVIEGVVLNQGQLRLREGVASALAAAFAVGSGHSGGREGPIVQLAASIGSRFCRTFGVAPVRARVLVAAGAAAGISASFNTPIAGAFFALEILLGNFALDLFAPVVVASVTGTVVGQALLGGDRIALDFAAAPLQSPLELLVYPLLGVVCGLAAVGFRWVLLQSVPAWDRTRVPTWARPAAAGVATGLFAAMGAAAVMGNGYAFVEQTIEGHGPAVAVLVLLLVAKITATALTNGARSGAGIFSPSLFVGAVVGTIFGRAVGAVWPMASDAGAYGMVGMGAVAAAMTQAPLTMLFMLFELTRNFQVLLPLVLTIAVANVVSAAFGGQSIYLERLARRGVRLDRGREELVMYDLRVADLVSDVSGLTIRPDATVDELLQRLLARRFDMIYVVDAERRYLGLIDIHDVKALLVAPGTGRVADVVNGRVPTLREAMPLADALPLFFRAGIEALPVIDDGGRLVGHLLERDVVGAYHREILKKDALFAKVASSRGGHDFFELPEGHVMDALDVQPAWVGRTLRDLHLPAEAGVTVIAVDVFDSAKGAHTRCPADVSRPLAAGDRLVVVGPEAGVEGLRHPPAG